jgi:hypothetical protein
MTKAPMTVESILSGEIAVTIIAREDKTLCTLGGYSTILISAEQLRKLADQLDLLHKAGDIYFNRETA